MTTRIKGIVVVLEENIREDDAKEGIMAAIRQIRGVLSVAQVDADGISDHIIRERVRQKYYAAISKIFEEEEG